MTEPVRIGCGSAGAADRVRMACDMVERGGVRYLGMDALAERTLALANLRRDSGGAGYDPRLPAMARELFPLARRHGVTITSNSGAADPLGAVDHLSSQASEVGMRGARVAVIEGDDVLDLVLRDDPVLMETGRRLSALGHRPLSANAYIGCEPLVEALAAGAEIVIGGRIADSSLFLAPMMHAFGWAADDWDLLGAGTCIGHLLECGAYVTGSNFADPPYLTVDSLEGLSMPMADVTPDGAAVMRKLAGSGGRLSSLTCKLQLGYEVHDPRAHPTPDVVADFAGVEVADVDDGVSVRGAKGASAPPQLKVVIGVAEGFLGENQVSFAGLGALDRALMTKELLEKRLANLAAAHDIEEWRVDLPGIDAIHGSRSPAPTAPYEVHVRGAARCGSAAAAEAVAKEVEYLMLSGPSGVAAGHRAKVSPIVSAYNTLIDRNSIPLSMTLREL